MGGTCGVGLGWRGGRMALSIVAVGRFGWRAGLLKNFGPGAGWMRCRVLFGLRLIRLHHLTFLLSCPVYFGRDNKKTASVEAARLALYWRSFGRFLLRAYIAMRWAMPSQPFCL